MSFLLTIQIKIAIDLRINQKWDSDSFIKTMAPNCWFLIFLFGIFFARDTLSLQNIVPRISGGNVRQLQELPFMVSLRVKNRFDQFVHICGGSILSSKLIISAAHCTDNPRRGPSAYRVYVGDGEEFEINRLTPHPYYNPMFLKNDLVIIELEEPIKFSSTIQPIELHRGVLENGTRVMTAGWGTKKVNRITKYIDDNTLIPIFFLE